MMKKALLGIFTVIAVITLFFGVPEIVQAQGGLVPCTNNCQICHLVQLLVNIMQLILGSIGSLTLVMFIIGGFWGLISAGRKGYVEKGKTTIINAIIGLIIVFLSYSIITFTIMALTGATSEGDIRLFGSPWSELIDCPIGTIPEGGSENAEKDAGALPESSQAGTNEPGILKECTTSSGEAGRCVTPAQQRIFGEQGTILDCTNGKNICGTGIDCCTEVSN